MGRQWSLAPLGRWSAEETEDAEEHLRANRRGARRNERLVVHRAESHGRQRRWLRRSSHTPQGRRYRRWCCPKWSFRREYQGQATLATAARETRCAGRGLGGAAITTGTNDQVRVTPGVGRRKRLPHSMARYRHARFSWAFAGGAAIATVKAVPGSGGGARLGPRLVRMDVARAVRG